jgi:hypothetical protein
MIAEAMVAPNQLNSGATVVLKSPSKKNPGVLTLESIDMVEVPSFVDYLRGGLELNMIVAIDFTGSNGVPRFPDSLHFMSPNAPNQYQLAIASIAQILLNYDSNQRIPAFGFGAKTKFGGQLSPVSHCFPLSGNPQHPEAQGVQHLMQLYQQVLPNLELSGPTYFAPLLQQAMTLALLSKQEDSHCYQTLLILTDGEIHDMEQTVELIIEAAELPLSVVIVGVGSADFGKMDRLDGDQGLFGQNGRKASRDIVQFVPFRSLQMNGDLLAKELLAELPSQVVQYMMQLGKAPEKPIAPKGL